MFHHAKLLVIAERTRQAAFDVGILLPLVQVSAENGVLVRNAMIHPGLKVVRLGERDAELLAEILAAKNRQITEVWIRPERQVLFGHGIDTALRNDVIRK